MQHFAEVARKARHVRARKGLAKPHRRLRPSSFDGPRPQRAWHLPRAPPKDAGCHHRDDRHGPAAPAPTPAQLRLNTDYGRASPSHGDVDLVGLITVGSQDPEDLREVIAAINVSPRMCSALAVSWAKYTGDGVLVYFGYPQAHEDDAERGAGRTGIDPSGGRVEVQCTAANPRGHCHWAGGGR